MRKPALNVCENKDADQLCGDSTADQPLCRHYTHSVDPQLPKPEILYAAPSVEVVSRFVPCLVMNPKNRINPGAAQIETTQILQQRHPISKFYNKEGIQQQPEDSIFLTPVITIIDTD